MQHYRPAALSRQQELELLEGLIAGSEEAWRHFRQQYDRLIFRCVRRATYRFSAIIRREDEHEIYANLMLQLLAHNKRKLRMFEPGRGYKLSTWRGLLASHAAYDYLRSLRRELPRVPLSEAEVPHCDGTSPFEQVQHAQRRRVMAGWLAHLSAKDQQFVALYFNRGLSPEDVANAMNISVKTVYSKRHKIQSRLEAVASAERLAA